MQPYDFGYILMLIGSGFVLAIVAGVVMETRI